MGTIHRRKSNQTPVGLFAPTKQEEPKMSSINEKVKQQYGNSVGVIKTTPIAITPEVKDKTYRNRLKKLYGSKTNRAKELIKKYKENR